VRRRKTPETEPARRIRAYAATYAAGGQKDRAQGMLDAADMVDELASRGGRLGERQPQTDLEARVARLERTVDSLKRALADRTFVPDDLLGVASVVGIKGLAPAKTKPTMQNGRPPQAPFRSVAQTADPSFLQPGEERCLAALAQREGGASTDELVAIVGYRTTSIKTYLGNLRAAAYVESSKGWHRATESGMRRAAALPRVPVGKALRVWWLESGKLATGESKLLQSLVDEASVTISDLFGEATGLQATSVKTYLGHLRRRRLIVRPTKGKVALAPILRDTVERSSPI
jgi:hypothetical protein